MIFSRHQLHVKVRYLYQEYVCEDCLYLDCSGPWNDLPSDPADDTLVYELLDKGHVTELTP